MSVIFHEPLRPPGEWGLWHITESENWLRGQVDLSTEENVGLDLIQGEGRRREFLAARLLLHHMSGRDTRGELYKDDAGKPHLKNSIFHISISHTVNYSAAIAHPAPCGIDVQRIVPRIRRLAPKFVGAGEKSQIKAAHELIQLHLIWSAKEAMYKAFGRRQIDFKEHLFVDFEDYDPGKTTATALLKKGAAEMLFDLDFRIFDTFVLVSCVERMAPL
ncbi:MAG: 4'-phosphopantetheinyl transferase superfamily protein [Bacteroidota bacterium]